MNIHLLIFSNPWIRNVERFQTFFVCSLNIHFIITSPYLVQFHSLQPAPKITTSYAHTIISSDQVERRLVFSDGTTHIKLNFPFIFTTLSCTVNILLLQEHLDTSQTTELLGCVYQLICKREHF
jgi:hypothetical protein